MTRQNQNLWPAATFLLCALVGIHYSLGLGGTEISGGRLTGPMLDLLDAGILLWALALILTFLYRRIAAAAGLAAALLCLPFYFYLTAPGPFRRVFGGQYSLPLHGNFDWDSWNIAAILTLSLAVLMSLRYLPVRTVSTKANERVTRVAFTADAVSVSLMDGRTISVPLAWYPKLLHASEQQRNNWKIAGGGYGIHWPDLDEDLSTEGLLRGAPAPSRPAKV